MSLVLGSAGNHLDASFLPEPQFHLQDGCRDPDAACLAEALAGRAEGGGSRSHTSPHSPHCPATAHHVQLALLVQGAGQRHGGEHTGRQGAVGVDGSAVLGVSVIGHSRVETGPVHPQEEGAWPDQTGPAGPGEEALDGPNGAQADALSFSSRAVK